MTKEQKIDVKIIISLEQDEDGDVNISIKDESVNPPKNQLNKIILLKAGAMMKEIAGETE